MKKYLASLAGVALLGTSLAIGLPGVETQSDEPATAYGFLIADDGGRATGFYTFPLSNAQSPELIGTSARVSAGTMAGNVYYAQTYVSGTAMTATAWNTVDVATGSLTKIADATEATPLYVDLTYDYTSDRLLGIYHYGGNSTVLAKVNPANGAAESIMDLPQMWMLTLAANFEGDIYMVGRGMTTTNYLYHIDSYNNIEQVGQVEFTGDYLQSMSFDLNSDKLYWASTTDYGSYFYSVDCATGACTTISSLANGGELTGLYIPFDMAADGTPAAVSDMVITNPAHDSKVQITFTVPELTVDGKALTEVTGWSLTCDDKEVNVPFTAATPGKSVTISAEVAEGLHVFKFRLKNSAGSGAAAVRKVYTGVDMPAAPQNVTVKAEGSKAMVSWDKVTTGAAGGWIDAADVKYNVVRMPDNKVIAKGITATSVADAVEAMNAYQYVITAVSGGKEGAYAATEPVTVGEYVGLPYETDFTGVADMVLWSTVDVNGDGYSWKNTNYYGTPAVQARSTAAYACDEWLVSPAIKLEAGKEYKISFDEGAMNPYYPPTYSIMLGRDKTPDALTTEVITKQVETQYPTRSIVYLPAVSTTGIYHIGIHAKWGAGNPGLYFGNVRIEENYASRLTLTVTDTDNKPLEGVKVTFGPNKDVYTTDADGTIKIIEIEPGNYDVAVEKFGYTTQNKKYTFTRNNDLKETIVLAGIATTSISGSVKYASGKPTGEATVYVCGYDVYTTHPAADGSFKVDNVYATGDYTVEVHAVNYIPTVVKVDGIGTAPVETGEIVLEEKLIAPGNIKGKATRSEVALSWDAPTDRETSFRYDDGNSGIINSYAMSPEVCENTATGVVYDTPGVFTGMSFKADKSGDVRILVFDVNEKGEPTGNLLYEQTVEGDDWYWVDVTFTHPVVAPRGAFFALAGDSRLYFDGESDGSRNPDVPVRSNRMWLSYDYTNLDKMPFHWTMQEEAVPTPLFRGNFCIRATGYEMGAPRSKAARAGEAAASATGYLVWRLPEGSESTQADWVQLTTTPVSEASFTDKTWANAAKGMYRYAVKAVYAGNEISFATLSDAIPCRMTSEVTVTLLSNAPAETAAGASAVLVEKTPGTHSYSAEADADGVLRFSDVWEGEYTLTATCEGFETLTEEVSVSGEEDFAATFTMTEKTEMPFSIAAEATEKGDTWLLRWNFRSYIFDDFESYDDFTVNPVGEIGWSYVDADGLEVAIVNDPLPNDETAAFAVLNPATSENERYTVPFSGERALCSLAARWVYDPVDDYIISPELKFKNDFVVNFRAYTYWKQDDYYRVGYSTTGKDLDDFIWSDKVKMDEEVWMNPTFNIPAEACYVAINYGGTKRVGVIDDIYIGPTDEIPNVTAVKAHRAPGVAVKYEVYLDGTKITDTTATEYLLENLAPGEHIAGVKSMYGSGASEMATTGITVVGAGIDAVAAGKYTVKAANGTITIGGLSASDRVTVADMAGRTYPVSVSGDEACAAVGAGTAVYVVRINNSAMTVVVK
ncbi:MAG: hypothetical protein HDS65_00535 [Bacteroidales bacterium]|nr:hypothetical protein [Bacteroidales bacterium]